MGELMRQIPFGQLMDWILSEYESHGTIFGIRKEDFYRSTNGTYIEMFGEKLSAPIGPAAGPNSQLCQNIVSAYLTGSRFIELKTVQKMDGEALRKCVPRPCINAQDEGYNVEWSTELTVPGAFDEYVKAWVALHVVARELGISNERDFIFNMSVGYDLEGIRSMKIDCFIEGLKNAALSHSFINAINWLHANGDRFKNIDRDFVDSISPHVCTSITLSTLHGCPPTEIERIAKYLMDVKKLHTYIKCNPTMLGYEYTRSTLDRMGYGYLAFDDHHFKHDLQYKDAVTMLRGLQEYATVRGLEFGVKITNTFPVKIEQGELPGEQMYMSGRALYPLSLSVAQKLSHDFGGKLAISYSGGADAFNITELFKTGICPITVCTTILKPGGYVRTAQMAGELQSLLASRRREIDTQALDRLVKDAFTNKYHQKKWRQVASRKIDSPLGLYDCFSAPCKDGGCPIDQDIPEYLYLVSEGRYDEAFEVIAEDNANPAITGAICNHHCQNKCVRVDYESPLAIRAMKLEAVKHAQDKYIAGISPSALRTKSRVAVIGAGPAGISAALFLRRNGVDVTVFEQREKPFGMVSYVIPEFRISADLIAKDFELAVRTGVNFKFGVDSAVNLFTLQRREGYDYVIIATGAWGKGELPLRKGADRLVDALEFLEESKAKNCAVKLGKRVAVIGGGDVAMDCARAAKRAPGVEHVSIVYRRTKDFMPAEPEELAEAEEDGVSFDTLLSPLSYDGKTLNCEQMELGERDSSGRRSVKGVGKMVSLEFDTVISAVGAKVDTGIFTTNRIALDDRGGVRHNKRLETGLPNVYVAGDAKSGPSTIVKAIADAKLIATDILKRCGLSNDFEKNRLNIPQELLYDKKGVLVERKAESAEGTRCLGCDQLCEICVDVCPNRANVAIFVPGAGANAHQILHIDGMCNECGNCGTFCPHKGDPYKDKLTLFWTHHDFNDSTNAGFLLIGGNHYKIRTREGTVQKYVGGDGSLPREFAAAIAVVQTEYKWMLAKM